MERKSWGRIGVAGGLAFGLCFAQPGRTSSEPASAGSMEGLAQACPTPGSLARFLRQRIRFADDARLFGAADYWQSPEEFLARGEGDCEDYAVLARAVLQRVGIEAFVFSLYGDGYAHTVCVFIEDGRYNVLNQDVVRRYRARSLEELASRLHPRWTWGAVAEKSGRRGRAVQEIRNPALG